MRFARQQRESIVHSVIEGTPQHNLSLRQKVVRFLIVLRQLYLIVEPVCRRAADSGNGGHSFSLRHHYAPCSARSNANSF